MSPVEINSEGQQAQSDILATAQFRGDSVWGLTMLEMLDKCLGLSLNAPKRL